MGGKNFENWIERRGIVFRVPNVMEDSLFWNKLTVPHFIFMQIQIHVQNQHQKH